MHVWFYSNHPVRLGSKIKADFPHVVPWPAGRVPSVEAFLRDPSPYLRKFWRKKRITQNSLVDKIDQEFISALLVCRFWEYNHSVTGRGGKLG